MTAVLSQFFHLAHLASAPNERETIILNFHTRYCSLCFLPHTGLWSLPVTANAKTQPNLPQKSFSGGSLIKQLRGMPQRGLAARLAITSTSHPCTSQKASTWWPRCKNTGGWLQHRWSIFSASVTEGLARMLARTLEQFSKKVRPDTVKG